MGCGASIATDVSKLPVITDRFMTHGITRAPPNASTFLELISRQPCDYISDKVLGTGAFSVVRSVILLLALTMRQ